MCNEAYIFWSKGKYKEMSRVTTALSDTGRVITFITFPDYFTGILQGFVEYF